MTVTQVLVKKTMTPISILIFAKRTHTCKCMYIYITWLANKYSNVIIYNLIMRECGSLSHRVDPVVMYNMYVTSRIHAFHAWVSRIERIVSIEYILRLRWSNDDYNDLCCIFFSWTQSRTVWTHCDAYRVVTESHCLCGATSQNTFKFITAVDL